MCLFLGKDHQSFSENDIYSLFSILENEYVATDESAEDSHQNSSLIRKICEILYYLLDKGEITCKNYQPSWKNALSHPCDEIKDLMYAFSLKLLQSEPKSPVKYFMLVLLLEFA